MFAVEQVQNRAVAADDVVNESDGLLKHGVAEVIGEHREALTVNRRNVFKVTVVEPVSGEFSGEGTRAVVFEHAVGLRQNPGGLPEFTGCGCGEKLVIGHAGPKKIAEATGKGVVGEGLRLFCGYGLEGDTSSLVGGEIHAIAEFRGHQDADQGVPDSLFVGEFTLPAEGIVEREKVVFFRLGKRPAVGSCSEPHHGFKMLRGGVNADSFDTAKGGIDAREMFINSLERNRIVGGEGCGLLQVLITQAEDDGFISDRLVFGALATGLSARTENFTALVEVVLGVGASCVFGDVLEFEPELLQFGLTFVVENQFNERCVVAIVAHHVVIAGGEQTAFVFGIVREETAALGNVEGVRKDVGEVGEGSLILRFLGSGDDQIFVPDPLLECTGGPADSGFLAQSSHFGQGGGYFGGGIRVQAQRFGVELPAAGSEVFELPVHEGLGGGA